ncbi:hypothetical protein MRB53_005954 [Persea americana]|uniref:Uncharacterized protein n=1 Tax=Persea americana TaxID=3435 RepID=A0ACC2MEZ4_PERAE|nr:hypothetical protein MRB53_005954 [Persea americana]
MMATTRTTSTSTLPRSGAVSRGYNFASTWEQIFSDEFESATSFPSRRPAYFPSLIATIEHAQKHVRAWHTKRGEESFLPT